MSNNSNSNSNNIDDDEPLKYIGYSMHKKQWIIIPKHKKRDDTYEFFNAGATAFTYVNPSTNKLVKIIHGPRHTPADNYAGFIKECEKEVEFQNKAAKNGLAPRIYVNQYGFVTKEHSFYSKDEMPYFYIIMEYLSEDNGWEHVFIGDKPDSIFCDYIEKIVSKTGLINVKDPQAHFYYNSEKDKDKLYMIDYGNCEECGERSSSECIVLMSSALGVNCNIPMPTPIPTKRKKTSITKRTKRYGGSKNYKRKTKCKTKCKTKRKTKRKTKGNKK